MMETSPGVQHVILYGQGDLRAEIEKSFAEAGIFIADNSDIRTLREAFVDHLKVIVNFLSVTALLAIFVGGLAIASAIGISIAERRREIGTMRAIGAGRSAIIRLVMVEVAIMGCFSWILAVLFSYPVAKFAGNEFGRIFLHSDLMTTVSLHGAVFWLLLSLTTAFASALIPAMRAAKAPLRDTLAYE
jgi:putative ABC transport system permease protein